MSSNAPTDPAVFLSGRERRAWRRAERCALRDHEAQQLTALRTLAATGGALTGLLYRDSGGHTAPAEFTIAGRRIRAGGVHRPVLRALTQAIAAMPAVPLLGASRYAAYWVLTFELPAAPLAVLVDMLSILPDRHDDSPWPAAPTPPTGEHLSVVEQAKACLNVGDAVCGAVGDFTGAGGSPGFHDRADAGGCSVLDVVTGRGSSPGPRT